MALVNMSKGIGFVEIIKVTGCEEVPGLRMNEDGASTAGGNLASDRRLYIHPGTTSDGPWLSLGRLSHADG